MMEERRGQRQRKRVPSKCSTVTKHWTSIYSRSESPSVAESSTAVTCQHRHSQSRRVHHFLRLTTASTSTSHNPT